MLHDGSMPGSTVVKATNDLLFFAVELTAVVVWGMWGWHVGSGPWRIVLTVVAPLVFALGWGLFAAPTATFPLPDPALLCFQLGVFLLSAAALWSTHRHLPAVVLAAVATAVVVLDRVLSH